MLAGLLFMLKCLGILILSIVLLVLAAFFLVLFSPIRYRLQGVYRKNLAGSFSVSWLFGILKVKGEKPAAEEMKTEIRLFGQPLGKKKKKKKRKKRKVPAQKVSKDILYSREKQETPVTTSAVPRKETEETPKDEPAEKQPSAEKETTAETQAEHKAAETPEKPKGIRRVKLSDIEEEPPLENPFWGGKVDTSFTDTNPKAASAKKKSFKRKTKEKKEKISGKFSALKKIWVQYTKIEQKREILKAVWRFLRSVTKGALPRKLCIKGILGTGNPKTTGYLLAIFGILKGKYGEHLQIQGNFAERTCELETAAQGKIVMGQLAFFALRLALAKPVRPLIHTFLKKRRENHGEGI